MKNNQDMLKRMFEMQKMLNDNTFTKKNICEAGTSTPITSNRLIELGRGEELGPNTPTNEWLTKYLTALDDESRELRDELLFKWWSKDHLNMQNIRVEIIDQLHFWMSLAMSSGMDAEDVFDVYLQKNEVNMARMESGTYSKESKTEDDNRQIEMGKDSSKRNVNLDVHEVIFEGEITEENFDSVMKMSLDHAQVITEEKFEKLSIEANHVIGEKSIFWSKLLPNPSYKPNFDEVEKILSIEFMNVALAKEDLIGREIRTYRMENDNLKCTRIDYT